MRYSVHLKKNLCVIHFFLLFLIFVFFYILLPDYSRSPNLLKVKISLAHLLLFQQRIAQSDLLIFEGSFKLAFGLLFQHHEVLFTFLWIYYTCFRILTFGFPRWLLTVSTPSYQPLFPRN